MHGYMIALLAGLLPMLAVHLAYFIAIHEGLAPACIPYFEGCTSISAAVRNGNALFLFRGVVIPCAIIMVVYWRLAQLWLRRLDHDRRSHNSLLWLGVTGSLFLILYADFLGSQGDGYRLMRRYGIFLFFGLTPLAQLLLVANLKRIAEFEPFVANQLNWVNAKLGFCCIMLVCGVVSVGADWLGQKTDQLGNILEWVFAFFIFSYFFITAYLWRMAGLGFALTTDDM